MSKCTPYVRGSSALPCTLVHWFVSVELRSCNCYVVVLSEVVKQTDTGVKIYVVAHERIPMDKCCPVLDGGSCGHFFGEVCLPRCISTHTQVIAVDWVALYPKFGQEDLYVVAHERFPMDKCCPVLDDPFPTLDHPSLAMLPEGDWM